MSMDKIELIAEQLLALIDMWNLIFSSSWDQDRKEKSEELLLEILELKQRELCKAIKYIDN